MGVEIIDWTRLREMHQARQGNLTFPNPEAQIRDGQSRIENRPTESTEGLFECVSKEQKIVSRP